jgi:hypothetical protein
MEAIIFSETLVIYRITQRDIPENTILHKRYYENITSNIQRSYIQKQ